MAKGEDLRKVGRAVAARRGELGMTQQELAGAASVDLKTVYNLESGTRWPIAKTRVAISAALGWPGDALAEMAAGREMPPDKTRLGSPLAGDVDLAAMIPMPEEVREAARPYAVKFHRLYAEAVARTGSTDPAGDEVFPPGSWDAQSWDRLRRQMDPLHRLGVIAVANTPADVPPSRRHGAAAGLTAVGAALGRSSAGGTA